MHAHHLKSVLRPVGLTAGVCLWVGLAGCADLLLSINPQGAEDEICAGQYVTGEDFVLCRRVGDGALGAFDVFMEELAVDDAGNVVFAGRIIIGKAEISQEFRPLDALDDQDLTLRGVFWELKQDDNRPLSLQGLEQIAEVTAAIDPDSTAAKQFIRDFVLHYFRNDNDLLAEEATVVYGFDHFMECADKSAADRPTVCAALYDRNADGTLNDVDYRTLVAILQGDEAAATVRQVDGFTLSQYYACRDQTFDNGGLVITPECHLLDRTQDDQVSLGDLPLLFDIGSGQSDQTPPVASAGEDRALSFDAAGGLVFLGGFRSYDLETDRNNLQFEWRQLDGLLPVVIQDADQELAFFQVPEGLVTGEFEFELRVTDDDAATPMSDTDAVRITVTIAQSEDTATPPTDPDPDPAEGETPANLEPGASFLNAARIQLGEDGQATVDQSLPGSDAVHVYDLGVASLGDRITVQCSAAAGSILDPMIALFDSNSERMAWNDDLASFDLDAEFSVIVSHDTQNCYLGVASSSLNPTAGDYRLTVAVEPQVGLAALAGQTVVLHWTAAEDVTIAGLEFGDQAEVEAAAVDTQFAEQTAVLQDGILATVRDDFAAYNITVLSTDDAPTGEVTTVYFGTQDQLGIFGVADNVDFYNGDRSDDAFIDLSAFGGLSSDIGITARAIGNVVSHEIGHLLGLMHTRDGTEIMDTTGDNSTLLADQTFGTATLFDFPIGQQNAPLLLTETVGLAAKGELPDITAGKRYCGTCGLPLVMATP